MAKARTTPMNMPIQQNQSTVTRPLVPVLIESGSYSKSHFGWPEARADHALDIVGSHEQSPRLTDSFQYETNELDVIKPDSQLREDLADAMKDCATISASRDSGELVSRFAVNLVEFAGRFSGL